MLCPFFLEYVVANASHPSAKEDNPNPYRIESDAVGDFEIDKFLNEKMEVKNNSQTEKAKSEP
jgi:hypothetical protein